MIGKNAEGKAVQLLLPRFRPDQWEIVKHPAKRKVLAMGRRWGKSVLAQCVAIPTAAAGGKVAWCVPNYKNGRPLWRLIKQVLKPLEKAGLCKINTSERMVEFSNGGMLALYSMDNPDSIRGEHFHLVIVDEAAMVSEEAWNDCIQPTLADLDGDCILISTPKGRNWFWKEYVAGELEMAKAAAEGRDAYQASFHAPTSANPNPNIRKAAELVKSKVPQRTYEQEWLAIFLEDGGEVFRNVRKCATGQIKAPYAGTFVGGIDWGKSNDWTVFYIMDVNTGAVVDWVRFNDISWKIQRRNIRELYDRWQPTFVLGEENSIGGPNIEALQDEGMMILPFNTNSATKNPMIESLQLSLEREEIETLDEPINRGELEAYEGKKSKATGRIIYGAPENGHDDTVIALGLADWARVHFAEYLQALEGTGEIAADVRADISDV